MINATIFIDTGKINPSTGLLTENWLQIITLYLRGSVIIECTKVLTLEESIVQL